MHHIFYSELIRYGYSCDITSPNLARITSLYYDVTDLHLTYIKGEAYNIIHLVLLINDRTVEHHNVMIEKCSDTFSTR